MGDDRPISRRDFVIVAAGAGGAAAYLLAPHLKKWDGCGLLDQPGCDQWGEVQPAGVRRTADPDRDEPTEPGGDR